MQITTIKMIRVLTEIGVPLSIIEELTQDRTPEKLLKLLNKYKNKVNDEIRFLQEMCSVISTFTDLLNKAIAATEAEITVAELQGNRIILGDICDYGNEIGFIREFISFCSAPHTPKLNMSFPVGGYWDSMEAFLKVPSRPERFFSLDPKGHERQEAGLYLIGYTHGYYGRTNDLPKRMAAFAEKNGLIFTVAVYNVYLTDELSVIDPEKYLLQVSASVMETRRVPSRRPRHHFLP